MGSRALRCKILMSQSSPARTFKPVEVPLADSEVGDFPAPMTLADFERHDRYISGLYQGDYQ